MKKRILSILLLCCMVLTLLPTTVLAADGPMDTIPKYDVSIDVYNRTSDITITDERSYYIYSSVPDKERDTWTWNWKIFIKGDKAAPHIFIDGVNIEMSPSSKGPAIELNKKASAYIYFIGKNSSLQGADGRAAIQKNRSEGQLYVLARTGTTVTCKGGDKAAGIGGSYATRNISNGYYNGDMYGHGVNMHFGSRSNPDYWGGTIAAIGGNGGAGIGGGQGGSGEKLYFYSGTVQANGGRLASGIGGSYKGRGSEIYIYGGTVSAQGGDGGAGIGGGCWTTEQDMNGINAAHDIYISGGTVTAKGGHNGAGIGGGQYVPARDITVTGGFVTATGHYGAAIGGGRWCRGMDITLTDATLNLSTNYRSNGSDAAAVGYGDIVYKPDELVADPSIATNDRIKVGSKDGKIVMLTANGYALRTDGKPSYFMHLTDFLIPDSDGMIDLSLLTLPYTQNYGWAITDLDVKMMETSCEGNHTYGWKNRNGCHVWGCTRCPARNPLERGPVPDGEHIPGEWEGQVKKCTVCGYVTTKDTTPPVIEGVVNGWDYTADDNDDGTFGTIDFTVRDPAAEGETVSGIQSVTINSEKQSVQSGQVYQLTAPDGGNGDEGLWHEIVVTDKAGNSTTAKVRVYRRHRVLILSDRNDPSSAILHLGVPHGYELELPFDHLPKEAYFVDLDNENIKIYREENNEYNFGIISSNRTFLQVIPETELPTLTVRVGNKSFWDYRADAPDEFCYVDPVDKYGEGYAVSLGISSDETSYYFETATRYTLKELKELDDKGSIKWYKYNSESWSYTLIGPSFEDYHGEWYVYAKATNEVGTKYVSSPKLILDCSDPAATVHPSGKELKGKANSSTAAVEGTTYWGNLQFKVHDETPVTVQDGKTVLEPDKNGIYTIPADMDDNVYHNIYIRDACGNTIFYLKNKVRQNTLTQVDTLGEQKLPHGAVLSASLPAEVTVRTAASGDQSVSVPVKWDEAADYAPAARQEQHFTVTGTLDLSDTGIVVPPEQEALLTVTAEVTVAGAPQYRATAASSENGTVTVTNAAKTAGDGTPLFYEGDWVMLSVVPNQGYLLKSLTVVQDGGESVACGGEDETYSFTQPGADVTVSAEFEAIQVAERPNVRVEGVYVYDGSEQTADVRGVDASMNITGDTGTDAGDYTVVVTSRTGQWADGSTDAVTAAWRIERAGQSAPTGLRSTAPGTEGGSDGKITGVDIRMEYRAEQESTYTACTGSEIENLPAGNYFVRYAEDRNHFVSPDAEVSVGAGASLADCTITFDAGSGSGSMETVTVREGGNYILPVCGFTAPANQEFKAWEIGGSEYNVGDPYIVNGNTTVTALWKDSVITPEFTITFDGNSGTPTAHNLRTSGLKLAALPDAFLGGDYSFGGWYTERDGGDRITTETVFWADTTVYAHWVYTGGGGGAYDSRCTIRASAGANGSITPGGNVSVRTGSDQTFLITPDEGYAISDVRIDGRSIGAVMRYTFENVKSAHTIEASFTAASTFADVPAGSYYERAVIWAAANGITNGVGNGQFGVDAPCTRAQAVTLLWRAAGSPAPEISAIPFTDVPVGSYYYDAVLWAVENGIAKGTSETTFGPDASCTRAQIVTFLYRAFGTPAGGDAAFADTTPNAYYAEAVRWAVATGVTTGTSNTTFSPNADCTRAQIVTFLWRCKKTG